MKTKKTSKTNTRSRIIFFAIALIYNWHISKRLSRTVANVYNILHTFGIADAVFAG